MVKILTIMSVILQSREEESSTVGRGAWSAGRIYDTFDQEQEVIVCFIIRNIVIADLIDDAHARS